MKFTLSLFIVSLLAAAHGPAPSLADKSPAPAPAVDCLYLITGEMSDCLSFVSNGSTTTKPEGKCCSGLKTVLSTDPECLCLALKTSDQYGLTLNITKTLTLPSVCKLSNAASLSSCISSSSPAASAAPGPGATSPIIGGNVPAPILAPGSSGSVRPAAVSLGYLVSALAICLVLHI
ncbi:hypothetical protein SAY86_017072 [Trapa natans]|uniref:Bifunctional inhibitor/plant lipid transfer protein/seed storage helical domain-containing protein n=1 Tax=Trapa natans TaxID=22666 RepID=A0AAN7R8G6_TRANT|nr:hypothetical protein SAY86_017072 [Trapa natans]